MFEFPCLENPSWRVIEFLQEAEVMMEESDTFFCVFVLFFLLFFFQRMKEQLRDSLESFNTEDIDMERNNTEEYRHVGVSPHNYNRVSEGQKKPHMSGSYGLSQKYDCAKKQRVTRGEDSPV